MEENKREVAEIATDMQDSKKREEKGKGKGKFFGRKKERLERRGE